VYPYTEITSDGLMFLGHSWVTYVRMGP